MNLQLAFSLLKQRRTVVKCNASRCSCICICICVSVSLNVLVSVFVACLESTLQCCKILLWRTLYGEGEVRLRPWGVEKVTSSACDCLARKLSLPPHVSPPPPLPTINRQNVLQYFWWLLGLLTVLWLGLWPTTLLLHLSLAKNVLNFN